MKVKLILLGATAVLIGIASAICLKNYAEAPPSSINPNPEFTEQQVVTPEQWTEIEKRTSAIITDSGEFRRDDTYDYSKLEDSEIVNDENKINAFTKAVIKEHGIFVKQ